MGFKFTDKNDLKKYLKLDKSLQEYEQDIIKGLTSNSRAIPAVRQVV